MATAKQLAWRKEFARRAKAGLLGTGKAKPKRKKNPTYTGNLTQEIDTMPIRRKANPYPTTKKKIVRRQNPAPAAHGVYSTTGVLIAKTPTLAGAKKVGQAYADTFNRRVKVK